MRNSQQLPPSHPIIKSVISDTVFKMFKKHCPSLRGHYLAEGKTDGKKTIDSRLIFLTNKTSRIKPWLQVVKDKSAPGGRRIQQVEFLSIGKFRLHSLQMGDRLKTISERRSGRIGAFYMRNENMYACTNMHVLLPDLIKRGRLFYHKQIGANTECDVHLLSNKGKIYEGILENARFSSIDVAMVRISKQDAQLLIRDAVIPKSVLKPADIKPGLKLVVKSLKSGEQHGEVEACGVCLRLPEYNTRLDDLIIINMKTTAGDSGAPVYTPNLMLVGMVIGGTRSKTFILPFHAIQDYLNYKIITKNIL